MVGAMIVIALGAVLGAWCLQQQATLPADYWQLGLLFTLVLVFSFRHYIGRHPLLRCIPSHVQQQWLLFTFASVFGFLYAAGFASYRLSDELPKAWERQDVEVVGVVVSLPRTNAHRERFRFDVEQVITPEAQVPQHISLNYYRKNTWQRAAKVKQSTPFALPTTFKAGQRWQLTVRLKRPHTTYNPNGYDFEAWSLAENIRATGYIRNQEPMQQVTTFVWHPRTVMEVCRETVGRRIMTALADQPYAGVIRALVIGDHGDISTQDWDVYLHTGTNHLVSISGLHISMLAGLAFSLTAYCWRRVPALVLRVPTRKAAIVGGVFTALLYACLAGLSVPTQRVLAILLTFALAMLLNRRMLMSQALAVAVLVVVLFDPWAVIAPGFWLSFSAVAFIAYGVSNRLKLRHWLVETAQVQATVTLGLLPFLIVLFGQASIISPVANALAIPVISLLVVPLAIVGALLPFDFILQAAHKILSLCMQALHWLADLPFAIWQQAIPPEWTILLALLGLLWLLLPPGFPQRWLGVLLMMPMFFVSPAQLAEGEMQVTVLDVGQGLSVLVKTANHVMVYDTGPKYNQEKNAGNNIVAPYLQSQGVNKINTMVVSHDDNDHSGGAASLLTLMPMANILSSYTLPQSISLMPKQSKCYAGQHWVWDDVRFDVLYPNQADYTVAEIKDNNRSCVIKVTSRYGAILLTGDIEKMAEQALLASNQHQLGSDVVIAPHHGSKTSSTHAFITAVRARKVVFTVGYLNRFKHPKPEIMQRYRDDGAALYRTDMDGAVLIDFTQQAAMQMQSWRSVRPRYWHDQFL